MLSYMHHALNQHSRSNGITTFLKSKFSIQGFEHLVDKAMHACSVCAFFMPRKGNKLIGAIKHKFPSTPGQEYQIDLCYFPCIKNGVVTNSYPILVLVDISSIYVIVKPLSNATVQTVNRKMTDIFTTIPIPQIVFTDSGPEFSRGFTHHLHNLGIKHIRGLLKSSSQGLVERRIQALRHYITKMIRQKHLEPEQFQKVLFLTTQALNDQVYPGTILTSKEIYFGPTFYQNQLFSMYLKPQLEEKLPSLHELIQMTN